MAIPNNPQITAQITGHARFGIVTSICLTDADRDQLITRDVSQWFPKRTYGVVMRKGAYLTPQARRFIELMSPELFPEPELA